MALNASLGVPILFPWDRPPIDEAMPRDMGASLMWIFTTHGFISIVQHNSNPDEFQVKSRTPRPLQRFWPDSRIEVIEWADYRFRINILKEDVIDVIASILGRLDYTGFKKECEEDEEYHWTLVQTWGLLNELQVSYELRERAHGL